MKLGRFDGGRIGLVAGDRVHDITADARQHIDPGCKGDPLVSALGAISGELMSWAERSPAIRIDEITWEAPVLRPNKIIGAPVNYRKHAQEANADEGIRYGHTETDIRKAGLFIKANSSLAGASTPLRLRFPKRRTDYEAELVIVIGREGSAIAEADAFGHVAGYCNGLDITLRGPEDRSLRKSIDGYSIVGPCLVTAEEVADPDDLAIVMRVNGEIRQSARTNDMVFGVARLIAFASTFYTLYPGDLIFTGTPDGVGPIADGDDLSVEITGLGSLSVTAEYSSQISEFA